MRSISDISHSERKSCTHAHDTFVWRFHQRSAPDDPNTSHGSKREKQAETRHFSDTIFCLRRLRLFYFLGAAATFFADFLAATFFAADALAFGAALALGAAFVLGAAVFVALAAFGLGAAVAFFLHSRSVRKNQGNEINSISRIRARSGQHI